jgi:hypothetical protein
MGRGELRARFWWGKPEGKRPLGRLGHRWEFLKIDLKAGGSAILN